MLGLKVLFDTNTLKPNLPITIESKDYKTKAALVLDCTPNCLSVIYVTATGVIMTWLIPIEDVTRGKTSISPLIYNTVDAASAKAEYKVAKSL